MVFSFALLILDYFMGSGSDLRPVQILVSLHYGPLAAPRLCSAAISWVLVTRIYFFSIVTLIVFLHFVLNLSWNKFNCLRWGVGRGTHEGFISEMKSWNRQIRVGMEAVWSCQRHSSFKFLLCSQQILKVAACSRMAAWTPFLTSGFQEPSKRSQGRQRILLSSKSDLFWASCLKFCHTSTHILSGKCLLLGALWLCFFIRGKRESR